MGLLDKSNKIDITAVNQDIIDKYSQIIFKGLKPPRMDFVEDKLYIHKSDRCNSLYFIPLKTSILHDMYNNIRKEFTIISDTKIIIDADSNIDVLEHVKIKCDKLCKIHTPISDTIPDMELKNLDIDADSLVIDLPGVKLSNVNIYAKNEITYTSVQGIELFKSISGNITTKRLDLRIYKSPLTESLYTEASFDAYKIYDQVINTNFIELLEPDKFNIDTYYISNWEFFNFYITKIHNTRRDYRHIRDDWYFA